MLSEEWIPTPLLRQEERQAVEIVEPTPDARFATLRVISKFLKFWLTGLWLRWTGCYREETAAVRLRVFFEDLGGLWIKVGQLLSLRTDMFSIPICRELSKLQYKAQGFPVHLVCKVLQEELGQDLGLVFERFDETPLAAASISQVHLAVLREPHVKVAVKVRRPDANTSFIRDLQSVDSLIRFFDFLGFSPHIGWRDAFWELDQMVREELDFRYEASNTRRMRKTLLSHGIYAPKIFLDYSTQSVLVSEYVDGVLMSDFIQVQQNDTEHLIEWCHENNINPNKVGRRLFLSAMRQLFEDNLFHADIHPGNILLLRDSRFALIDFGTIGRSEKDFLSNYTASLRALSENDYGKAADFTLRLAINPPAISRLSALRADLVRSYRQWEARTHLHNLGYHARSLASAGSGSGKIMYKYEVQLTWAFMRISRTWATLDASLSFLIPSANHIDLFRIYFREAAKRRSNIRNTAPNFINVVKRVAIAVEEYNMILSPILRWYAVNTSSLVKRTEGAAKLGAALFRMLLILVVFITAIGLYIFIHIHYPELTLIKSTPEWSSFIDGFREVAYGKWVIFLSMSLVFIVYLRKIIKTLTKPY